MLNTQANFDAISVDDLESMGGDARDALPFGVVGFGADTVVQTYNATEARMSGLDAATVIGVPFFDAVAQCMNNFMVAQRFEDEPEIDDVIDYVLTLRMRPTPVRLRLIKAGSCARRYLLIQR